MPLCCDVKCPKNLLDKVLIPNNPNVKCNYIFTRCPVGTKLMQTTRTDDFTFFDPYNYETSATYNPLHDPYLKSFFKKKVFLNHIKKNKLVSEDNEVICSLKDFNSYRKFLFRINSEKQRNEMRLQNLEDLDRHRLKISDQVFEKIDKKRAKQKEMLRRLEPTNEPRCLMNPIRYENIVVAMKRKKLERECEKVQKFKQTIQQHNERGERHKQLLLLKNNKLKERGLYRNLEIVKKQIFVTENLKCRTINVRKTIYAKEKDFAKKMAKRKLMNTKPTIEKIIKCNS
ncbi:unnamed protein product [Diamesa tonsa]